MIKDWQELKVILPRKNDLFTFREVLGDFNLYHFEDWLHLLNKNDVVIDLGAHIGLFSLAVSRHVGHVYAVEPEPENFEILLANIEKNQLANITPVKKVISSHKGETLFYVSNRTPARHSLYTNEFLNFDGKACIAIEVKMTSLSTLFKEYNIERCKLVKADIEGAEYEVFLTLPDDIINRIDMVILEWHEGIINGDRNELEEFFRGHGFDVTVTEETNLREGSLITGMLKATRPKE